MAENSRQKGKGPALDDVAQPPTFDLEISIEKNLPKVEKAEMPQDAWKKVCIYRAPKQLRNVNPNAFDPHLVSIGPYHRGKEGLTEMDRHKWRCIRKIIDRSESDEKSLFNSIRKDVGEARRCYEGTIELSDDEFMETMVLDGCFLLEIFRGCLYGFKNLHHSPDDPVFSLFGALVIRQDVKKLENQVPLFILERLLALITKEMKDKKEVIELALNYLGVKKPKEKYRECVHCLDIYRKSLLDDVITSVSDTPILQETSNLDSSRSRSSILCVTKLRDAGIQFKKRETKCFFDIKFEAGVLHIPMLLLQANIKREFPNLTAFEQCHRLQRGKHVTAYAKFMADLIDSSDDVAYLHDRGIIDPFGGSYQATADFFKSIAKGAYLDPSAVYLSGVTTDLLEEVKRYRESKIRNFTVQFMRKYFTNPWSLPGLLAASVGLVLALVATFFGVYAYFKHRR